MIKTLLYLGLICEYRRVGLSLTLYIKPINLQKERLDLNFYFIKLKKKQFG